MARQNTRIESEGAEFLVLGQLLIAGIATYKTYTNMPGYDLVATNADRNTSARISVKSRWKTKAEGFIMKRFDCDFVVIVKLNRGSKDGRAEVRPPEFFVVPVGVLHDLPRSGWSKFAFNAIPELDRYRDRWDLVRDFLQRPTSRSRSDSRSTRRRSRPIAVSSRSSCPRARRSRCRSTRRRSSPWCSRSRVCGSRCGCASAGCSRARSRS